MKTKFILLFQVFCFVACSQKEKFLICKSVSSIFDLDIEADLDNTPTSLEGAIGNPIGLPPMQSLGAQLKEIKDQLKCLDGVVAGGKCFRLLYRVGVKISFLQAENLCAFHGGIVPEIPNQQIYEAVFQYIRRYWSVDLDARDRNFVQVFLSSLYENGRVLLRNGQPSYLNWHPRYPTSNPDHRRMLISVTINNRHPSSENGMFNYNMAYTAMPLCQFSLY